MSDNIGEMEWAIYKEAGFLSHSITFNDTC